VALPQHILLAVRDLVAAVVDVDADRLSLTAVPMMIDATGTMGISLTVLVDGEPLTPEVEAKLQEMITQTIQAGQDVARAHREAFGEVCCGVLRVGVEYDTPCSITEITKDGATVMLMASTMPEPISRAHIAGTRVHLDYVLHEQAHRISGVVTDLCERLFADGLPKMFHMTLKTSKANG